MRMRFPAASLRRLGERRRNAEIGASNVMRAAQREGQGH